ncbi:MAG: cyclic nucleotide-binding domain-containing protein [Deltaproteobacteria bacterium]|nr:cyclic nucleotide-binding domain-containing protein [Deltaproteobacteria bacterium]
MDLNISIIGFFWGALSAVSLPLGAMIGLATRPSKKVTSALMAFGGGALLFALTIELFGHALHAASDHHGRIVNPWIILSAIFAALIGGLIFELLNQLLNNQGAFLRKGALINKHIKRTKHKEAKKLLRSLSRVKLLQLLPAEEIIRIIPHIKRRSFVASDIIFKEGDAGEELYFILSGQVSIERSGDFSEQDKVVANLGRGDVFGEISLISKQPRTATATAKSAVKVLVVFKRDFERVLEDSAALQEGVQKLVQDRIHDLTKKLVVPPAEAQRWENRALDTFQRVSLALTDKDIEQEVEEHGNKGGAATAIWMGIALDGIPESLVIGMLVVAAAAQNKMISLAFIVSVFLANLPEAMSSAISMRRSGIKKRRIIWMWTSLCIMTGIGALIGTLIFPPHVEGWLVYFVFGIEGLAAGAMLTMISETMLPEAFEQGGSTIVGLSTLVGFLSALAVKLIH